MVCAVQELSLSYCSKYVCTVNECGFHDMSSGPYHWINGQHYWQIEFEAQLSDTVSDDTRQAYTISPLLQSTTEVCMVLQQSKNSSALNATLYVLTEDFTPPQYRINEGDVIKSVEVGVNGRKTDRILLPVGTYFVLVAVDHIQRSTPASYEMQQLLMLEKGDCFTGRSIFGVLFCMDTNVTKLA